jgi:DNA-binding transcriptional LysR family regulator
MHDYNDLFIFSRVVAHGGFTGAANELGLARSSICRRISQLEESMGVRLVQRSTRRFAVTELGLELNCYALRMIAEASAAYERAACAKARPAGLIRLSCPSIVAEILIAPLISRFTERNPEVRVAVVATDRKVDMEESFDLSIRLQSLPSKDSGLVMRSLGIVQQALMASPRLLDQHGRPDTPEDAAKLPTVGYGSHQGPHVWKLIASNDKELQVRHEPRFVADDLALIRHAALAGVGIAQLPLAICLQDIRDRRLEMLLPDYLTPQSEVQILFPSRRGMLPGVRSLIDFLAAHCAVAIAPSASSKPMTARQSDKTLLWPKAAPLNAEQGVLAT